MARVPRVSRFEYVVDYLTAVNERLSSEAIEERLAKRKTAFESEKYAALGRGGPFGAKQKLRLMNAREILKECKKLCSSLVLTDESSSSVTKFGLELITSTSGDRLSKFMGMMFSTYPILGRLLMALKGAEANELEFINGRHTGEYRRFRAMAEGYGLDLDMVTFLSIRDILWQAGYLNWFAEKRASELWYRVYLTALIHPIQGTNECIVSFKEGGTAYCVGPNQVDSVIFDRAIWEEYLRRTNDVPLRPVFYAELRTATCMRLRIGDGIFDEHVRRLLEPTSPFNVVWSSGTLPFSKERVSMLKNVPPKSADGQYMVYLKIGRR